MCRLLLQTRVSQLCLLRLPPQFYQWAGSVPPTPHSLQPWLRSTARPLSSLLHTLVKCQVEPNRPEDKSGLCSLWFKCPPECGAGYLTTLFFPLIRGSADGAEWRGASEVVLVIIRSSVCKGAYFLHFLPFILFAALIYSVSSPTIKPPIIPLRFSLKSVAPCSFYLTLFLVTVT